MVQRKIRVAIACQGGGSHAAFAAGVLRRLLAPDAREKIQIVGLSGTSGGAMCAALAWSGLLQGGEDLAIRKLTDFWEELKADALFDAMLNFWGLVVARSPVTAEISPYDYQPSAETRLIELIRKYVELDRITPAQRDARTVSLLVGATDVLSGERVIFKNDTITERHLLASAAIPPLFRAVKIGQAHYWDGLFSTNPPIREFTDSTVMSIKPEEIWIVQINPKEQAAVPQLMSEIVDRRNELSGNLSLAQEVYFIEKMNELTALIKGSDSKVPWKYEHIEVKVLEMPLPSLDHASKLDRNPAHIQDLVDAGLEHGGRFLEAKALGPSASLPISNQVI